MTPNDPSIRAIFALLLAAGFLATASIFARRRRSTGTTLVFVGSCLFAVVAIAHFCEAFHLLPTFGWGRPNSPGHYIDLTAAILGTLAIISGVVILAWRKRVPPN